MNHATTAIGGQKVTRVTDFDIVNETLGLANIVASRIEALADTLLGSQPQPANGVIGSGPELPGGVLPRLAMSANYARGRLGEAMAALERIEDSLP